MLTEKVTPLIEFCLWRPQVSKKFERTDICYSDMAFGDLHLTFEEHANTTNADMLLRKWLNVLVSKRYERGQKHLNGLVIKRLPGAGGRE
ncbi:hypothetical protein QQF64_008578 [Cirrhinus molitorella]|uniref:Uncharacterized protein n=1 Tax=Cirrhinus molitorella TaxID=172907 RepID=A0ABR3M6J9_9TELE